MKVLIIEDEHLAAEYLAGLVGKLDAPVEIIDTIDSVKNAIKWFLTHPEPDLILMDINLGDGLCFEIFEVIDVACPVIFTTAYDEYAIRAFKVNGIDYLLKPIDTKDLQQAFAKFTRLHEGQTKPGVSLRDLGNQLSEGYKIRFIVKIGDRIKTLPVPEILYFVSENKMTYAVVSDRRYPIDYTLDRVEELINPQDFIRINRKYIIAFQAIRDIVAFSNSRYKVQLVQGPDDDVVVARDRVQTFKEWLDR